MLQPKVYIKRSNIILPVITINYREKIVQTFDENKRTDESPSLAYEYYSFGEVEFLENTGHKDVDDNEIFVGDIVEVVSSNKAKGYIDENFNVVVFDCLKLEIDFLPLKVVGNVKENKGLLNV